MKIDYRLALDLGTNSIGWCVYRLALRDADKDDSWKITAIQRMGVRIFSDGRSPKDLASLAASRRQARQARRRRDRMLKRKQQLLNQLIEFGLMPKDEAQRKVLVDLDPYTLRARGLKEALPPYYFGRAIFHLARKRGFRSGRKDFQTEENAKESGKIDSGIKRLREKLKSANCRTVGEYLSRLHDKREPVLARPASDGNYPVYLSRELVAEEFDALWKAQQSHNPDLLTQRAYEKLRDTILFQRKLRPVQPGKCLFERDQPRALLAHPLSQRFRILQELANLRIRLSPSRERALSRTERDELFTMLTLGYEGLSSNNEITWAKLKSVLSLPKQTEFNLDTSGRRGLKADTISIALSSSSALGQQWREWPVDRQNDFLHKIRKADHRAELSDVLPEEDFTESQLDAIFRVAGTMPDDFGSLSLAALKKIVPVLESNLINYSDAVVRAGYGHHSMFYSGELKDRLPYYGQCLPGYTQPRDPPSASTEEREYGRIPNPTVHVGLNQLRKVVNAIIRRYGHPKQIIVEVARDVGLSGENRRKLEKEQRENRERNERYGAELIKRGVRNSRENRQRLQLFEEIAKNDPLGAECIYSGERISLSRLFSEEIEIDHVLPFSRSLDDGIGNKVLCVRKANRYKGNRTPHVAFSDSPGGYNWKAILERAERLVPRKAKRFRENALEEFLKGNDFLARHLNDTAYFSRVAREYLTAICPPNCIWVSTGRLTFMLRGKWGLNRILSDADRKERTDHRHHAIDAAVIGACDRSLIKAMADAAHRAEERGENRLLEELPPPWAAFFDDIKSTVERIVVSHKPDHRLSGALHNETRYGLVEGPDKKGVSVVTVRAPLISLNNRADLTAIADSALRARLMEATEGFADGTSFKSALAAFSESTRVRRVRLRERWGVQPISNPHRERPSYVRTDDNYCYEVVRNGAGKWLGYAISRFAANRITRWSSDTGIEGDPLVMRLHIGDSLCVEDSNAKKICRVVKLSNSELVLAEHFEAGALKNRHSDPNDSFRYLRMSPKSLYDTKSRPIGVDELGYVNDPGFRE